MSAVVLNGRDLAEKMKENMKARVEALKKKGVNPGLAVVLVGDNPASQIYVRMKKKDCAEVGITSYEYLRDKTISEDELLALVDELNKDERIHGILVQLPLPDHINEIKILERIDPEKDADGFNPINMGRLLTGAESMLPCTPAGVMELIKLSGVEIKGKDCVVVGRSNIVGKPAAVLLLREHGTVTICHSRTKNLGEVTRRADILVAAVGRANMITAGMVKPGAVVIDVGMNRLEGNKVVGDVDYEGVKEVASAITPVPKGVGPMTRAMLLMNTLKAAER
ncbi:MAG TPA: bifunctional methylenetetrahydrofolate dehydrogenase/methenyltetrahydrofolate cyclohydrolase FolD [Clostridia bacterium]|nr:bifunctional methylenetetrahydrofolate dehydrogenase/methenyltetrahydrofolate cyclohydrolase FolD [Clostridia bacterium]HRX42051.1 bifunctional methylenetetrahydrofolate dehydrogenase/methenyltetrahydrofolate cyclohydrolase FolD [Clostridia bacterium]